MSRGHGQVERYVLSFVMAAQRLAIDSSDEEIYLAGYNRALPASLGREARIIQISIVRESTLVPSAFEIARALAQHLPADSVHAHVQFPSLPPAPPSTYESVRRASHLLLRDGCLQRVWNLLNLGPNLHLGVPGCAAELRALEEALEYQLGRPLRWRWSSTPPLHG